MKNGLDNKIKFTFIFFAKTVFLSSPSVEHNFWLQHPGNQPTTRQSSYDATIDGSQSTSLSTGQGVYGTSYAGDGDQNQSSSTGQYSVPAEYLNFYYHMRFLDSMKNYYSQLSSYSGQRLEQDQQNPSDILSHDNVASGGNIKQDQESSNDTIMDVGVLTEKDFQLPQENPSNTSSHAKLIAKDDSPLPRENPNNLRYNVNIVKRGNKRFIEYKKKDFNNGACFERQISDILDILPFDDSQQDSERHESLVKADTDKKTERFSVATLIEFDKVFKSYKQSMEDSTLSSVLYNKNNNWDIKLYDVFDSIGKDVLDYYGHFLEFGSQTAEILKDIKRAIENRSFNNRKKLLNFYSRLFVSILMDDNCVFSEKLEMDDASKFTKDFLKLQSPFNLKKSEMVKIRYWSKTGEMRQKLVGIDFRVRLTIYRCLYICGLHGKEVDFDAKMKEFIRKHGI